MTSEANCSDMLFTAVFNPFKNNNTGVSSKTINRKVFYLPIQDVFVHFLNKLRKANEFLEQPSFM